MFPMFLFDCQDGINLKPQSNCSRCCSLTTGAGIVVFVYNTGFPPERGFGGGGGCGKENENLFHILIIFQLK